MHPISNVHRLRQQLPPPARAVRGPHDSTPATARGSEPGPPAAIRHESYGLETYSPYQNADLTDFDVFDSGDLELRFRLQRVGFGRHRARAEEILHDGKFPLLLGGEHLVTLGAVRGRGEEVPRPAHRPL